MGKFGGVSNPCRMRSTGFRGSNPGLLMPTHSVVVGVWPRPKAAMRGTTGWPTWVYDVAPPWLCVQVCIGVLGPYNGGLRPPVCGVSWGELHVAVSVVAGRWPWDSHLVPIGASCAHPYVRMIVSIPPRVGTGAPCLRVQVCVGGLGLCVVRKVLTCAASGGARACIGSMGRVASPVACVSGLRRPVVIRVRCEWVRGARDVQSL